MNEPKGWRWTDRLRLIGSDGDRQLLRSPAAQAQRYELAKQQLQAMPPPGDEVGAPPPPVRMNGVLATEEPYLTLFLGRDDDGYRAFRFTQCQLDLSAGKVLAPGIGTPAGVMLSYEHLTFLPSLGKVETMAIEERELRGEYVVSPSALLTWYPGGISDMEAGLHSGLSIGFSAVEPPVYERRSGTRFDPDRVKWRKIELAEVAVTDLPALSGAGRIGTVSRAAGDSAGGKDEEGTAREG